MNCYYCNRPLIIQDNGNPKLNHQFANVMCTHCKAVYRVQLTVLREPEPGYTKNIPMK